MSGKCLNAAEPLQLKMLHIKMSPGSQSAPSTQAVKSNSSATDRKRQMTVWSFMCLSICLSACSSCLQTHIDDIICLRLAWGQLYFLFWGIALWFLFALGRQFRRLKTNIGDNVCWKWCTLQRNLLFLPLETHLDSAFIIRFVLFFVSSASQRFLYKWTKRLCNVWKGSSCSNEPTVNYHH